MNKPPMVDLHEKYGDIVRLGPNILSFGNPDAIKDIYGAGKAWDKSSFYSVQAAVAKGESALTLFSSRDIPWHNALRKAINPFFTATASVGYEGLIDKTIDVFLQQWDTRFAGKKGPEGVVDLADWLLFFAFDVIGELTYGSRHGFLESGSDSQGIIAYLKEFAFYGSIMGPSSALDKLFRHNPVLLWLGRKGFYQSSTFPLVLFVAKRLRDRINYYSTRKDHETEEVEDLLDKFFKAKEAHPKAMSEKEVLSLSLTMVLAGAETIAITLTAFFYYILRNPASSVLLERVVPSAGSTIAGEDIPGGTVVGVSSWAAHRNKAVFGDDAADFRPERWLEAGEERVRAMERSMLHFGAGNHMCLGKNISVREIYKVVPSLLRTFKMELVHPERDWTLVTMIGVVPVDVKVHINRRTG